MAYRTLSTTIFLVTALALLAGCSFPKTSADKAEWFFAKGKETIVESLEDQGLQGTKLDQVKTVIADHKAEVVDKLAGAFAQHRETFKTLSSGQDTATLLASEDRFHRAQREALRSIGAMHADIEETVGAETWAAANKQRRQRFEEKFSH